MNRKRIITIRYVLMLSMMVFLLTGCVEYKEADELAYVIAIGLDKSKRTGLMKVTYLISNPEVGTLPTGGGTNEPPTETVTVEASDFISSRNTANVSVTKELSYDLLKVFIISEELAKETQFIRHIYDATKDREIRRDVILVVSKEQAHTFLNKNKPKLETRPHKYFELITERVIQTGMSPPSDLHRFIRITEGDEGLFLSMYATTKLAKKPRKGYEDEFLAGEVKMEGFHDKTQFLGSAVFKEGKMIGKLTGEETRLAQQLDPTSELADILGTFPDPFHKDFRIAARIIKDRPNDVKTSISRGRATIDVTVPLTVEILSNPSMVDYAQDNKKKEALKKSLEKGIENKMMKLVKKTMKDYKAEPFYWSSYARKKFKTAEEYSKFDWMRSYPDSIVNIKVKIRFGEFGQQYKVPKMKEVKD
ncbi:Ger(x)C family spore germination protein [Peribacillus sp. SCS-155]|uniref:Ger(x)C family spore germination protein n=1 Tax=Peribacillus sedimenti TaxID=3115297 RepID=UPI003906769A